MKPWFEIQLPTSPAMTGIIIGAIAGIVVFLVVVALVTSRRSRAQHRPSYVSLPPPSSAPPAVVYHPTTALSARAFAKMGYAFGERLEDDDVIDPDETADARPVSVPSIPAAPHPLSVIPASSSAMIPISVASVQELQDLDYDDDAKTEVSETFFDEPPRPHAPPANVPKIRRVAPERPRFVT